MRGGVRNQADLRVLACRKSKFGRGVSRRGSGGRRPRAAKASAVAQEQRGAEEYLGVYRISQVVRTFTGSKSDWPPFQAF